MTESIRKVWLSVLFALAFAFASPALADESPEAEGVEEATQAVSEEVEAEADRQTAKNRERIMQEAVDALSRSREALTALEEGRTDEALDALAVATGKLELIVARQPDLALAPTDVSITSRDLYGSADGIRRAIETARDALNDGDIQTARRILDGLGSELIVTVTNLPLATYPDAIKSIAPLIDSGNIEEAKTGLRAALNTLVLTDLVYPLPMLRSEALLEKAEELARIEDRTEAQEEDLTNHLAAIRNQLEMGEILGYGEKKTYRALYSQLDRLEKNVESGGKSEEGFFEDIQESMAKLWK